MGSKKKVCNKKFLFFNTKKAIEEMFMKDIEDIIFLKRLWFFIVLIKFIWYNLIKKYCHILVLICTIFWYIYIMLLFWYFSALYKLKSKIQIYHYTIKYFWFIFIAIFIMYDLLLLIFFVWSDLFCCRMKKAYVFFGLFL